MNGRYDHLVELQMGHIFFYYRGAFYQNWRFIHRCFIIYYLSAGLAIIAIAKVCRFAGIILNNYIMSIAHQHPHCLRSKRNAVFLERSFLRYANMQLCPFGFYIQGFLQCFVTKRSADDRLLLRHVAVNDFTPIIGATSYNFYLLW